MNEPKSAASKAFAAVFSLTGALVVLCLGGAVAISAPKFMAFKGRSAQVECKANLKLLGGAQRELYAEKQRFSETLSELDVKLEPNNRYVYLLGPATHVEVKDSAESTDALVKSLPAGVVPGVSGVCPDCSVTLVCVGAAKPVLHDVWKLTVRTTGQSELEHVREEFAW